MSPANDTTARYLLLGSFKESLLMFPIPLRKVIVVIVIIIMLDIIAIIIAVIIPPQLRKVIIITIPPLFIGMSSLGHSRPSDGMA